MKNKLRPLQSGDYVSERLAMEVLVHNWAFQDRAHATQKHFKRLLIIQELFWVSNGNISDDVTT